MSAPTTDSASRSPSPSTPESSDILESVGIQSELDPSSSWYHSMNPTKMAPWMSNPSIYAATHKSEEEQMLRLDDLIEQHAYDDSPSSGFPSNLNQYSPLTYPSTSTSSPSNSESVAAELRANTLLVSSRQGPVSSAKPVPPPTALLRKHDSASITQRVTRPPKELCFNLPIMFPSIPEGGTKSRVETQVRVTIDLADSNSSSDPSRYDRVGSWKWLKLPAGTATKKRTRKQGKIDPDPQDILHLTATVSCATPPYNRVLSCSSCQAREAKRVAKKLAARVRPARSESDSDGNGSTSARKSKHHEDTTSIIQFNCAEILDFSTGSAVLPLRITCYCRHHREKVGFNVHFSMTDHSGRLVGSGVSRPIMITDDHKTSNINKPPELINGFTSLEQREWSQLGGVSANSPSVSDVRAPSKRKKEVLLSSSMKKRTKPYDSLGKPIRAAREESVSSAPSPSTSYSPLPASRASTPSSSLQAAVSNGANSSPPQHMIDDSETTSSPDTLATPLDNSSDVHMPDVSFTLPTEQPLPLLPDMIIPGLPHPMSYMFFDPTQRSQPMQLQLPTIHRLIPSMGPTHGGIEVTVLGANFHPTVQLNCIFGDVAASSTQRWSDNTLVCVLPPRTSPGIVAVWFEGFHKTDEQNNTPPSLFTYSDESDRALMELALQVVGLKMTGKIEDAKNVAMRIVGNAGNDNSESNNNAGMMQLNSSSAMRDLRPLLAVGGEGGEFEEHIINLLSIVDTPLDTSAPHSIPTSLAISHASLSGQTLLHLAAFLKLQSLTTFLVRHGADLDARDRNGYTPLHFAALSQSTECTTILLQAGADHEIVNACGKTPEEIALPGFFKYNDTSLDTDSDVDRPEDSDADLGDAEEEDDDHMQQIIKRRLSRRSLHSSTYKGLTRRSANVSRASTPQPVEDSLLDTNEKSEPSDERPDAASKVDPADAKKVVSFMEKMIQRTLAQIPATQGIIPQLPLPNLPHLPNLPDLPAVPWGAFPQIPMVFPVFVPMMPNWPAFLGGDHTSGDGPDKIQDGGDEAAPNMTAVALRAAQEWRATWEKWVALAVATTARQQTEELPPPEYTPRATDGEAGNAALSAAESSNICPSSTAAHVADTRPVGYADTPLPDQIIEQYAFRPPNNPMQQRKKNDRMLLWFWLPILFLSMIWALHNGVRLAFQTIKVVLLDKTPLRA